LILKVHIVCDVYTAKTEEDINDMSLLENTETITLDNGLRVILKPVHFAPLVSVWAWYHVGSKNESPGITGASHWVEHMNFKGTENISKQEIKGLIEKHGGFWNGYTFIDQTTYMETLSRDGLETALRLEAERMGRSLFLEEDVASERTVIISELRGNENDPNELLDRETTAAAFRAHPYKWPVIGWQGDIETMTRDDLYNHYRKFYSPDNATLVVCGDFNVDEAKRLVEKHYGPLERWKNGRRAITTTEPPQRGERRVIVRREGNTPLLQIAYHSPAFGTDDYWLMLLFDALLSGPSGLNIFSGFATAASHSSRLYKEIIEANLAAAAGAALLPVEQPYLYTMWSILNSANDFDTLENAFYQAIEDLIHRPVPKNEFNKAKTQLKAKIAFEQEGITNIAHQLGYYTTIGALEKYDTALETIDALALDDVKQAGLKYLGADNRTVGQFHPIQQSGQEG
jgi:zinc protease